MVAQAGRGFPTGRQRQANTRHADQQIMTWNSNNQVQAAMVAYTSGKAAIPG
jgi:hypothetical protein